ncbi:MAG: lysine 2,3-aminomutase [Acidobacteriota bacterium]
MGQRYEAITTANIRRYPEWSWLPPKHWEAVEVVGRVFPFRTNTYVTRELIDWSRVPNDPIFRLTFPDPAMLGPEYAQVRRLLRPGSSATDLKSRIHAIQWRHNPHPAGQLSDNVPRLNGRPLPGLQHKYRETVLYFPAQGQTCHAYCSYCFRWPQFIGARDLKFKARDHEDLIAYLRLHPEVTDLLVTGGDPMVMKAATLRRHLEPVLDAGLPSLQSIRIGTKALSYWPYRFVSDADSDDVLRFFEEIVSRGFHLAVMAHFSHPRELDTSAVEEAVRRIRNTGAEIRTQAPVIRHVNDRADVWAELWRRSVRLGMIPYYMFVARDTGPREYFKISLARAHEIFRRAYRHVSGLARTVRGPSMSAHPGKVHVVGISKIGGRQVFVLQFLQARDPRWVGRPFFAEFDPEASWLDELRPAFGRRFFFEAAEDEVDSVSGVA